jgi:glycosyltransferase involved in cell wall biosynthesis
LLGAHWHDDDPGGLNHYLADLHAALRSAGVAAMAVVSGPATGASTGVEVGGRFDLPFPLRLWSFARAAKRAASMGVTVVDAHFAFYAFGPLLLGGLGKLPLVVHFQGPWAVESMVSGESRGWRIRVKRWVEISVYRRARTVIVLSPAFKDLLVDRYGLAPWSIEVVPPGVELDHFRLGDRMAARARLEVRADTPLVVVVRRLVPRVGIDVLLDAWVDLQAKLPEARLLVVGEGPERARLTSQARESGIASSVRFLGRVDGATLVDCYQAADLSVVPTLALEGFGLVALESLACGTPAVVTDSGGLPGSVTDLDPSLVVPAGDGHALSRRLLAALDGREPPPSRDRCRAHAESFAWSAVAQRNLAIYTRVQSSARADRQVRVVYLDHCAQMSGGELALLRLLPALDQVDAHVILGEEGPLVAKLRQSGVSVAVMEFADAARSVGRDRVRPGMIPPSVLWHAAGYVARLAARLHRLRPDLVHTNSLKAALYGGAAARLAGVPVIWHMHDRISVDYLPSSACLLVKVAARLFPRAMIANSNATLATIGRATPDHVVIPPPLGFTPSRRPPPPRGAPLRVGIVGRLDPWKGQHIFLEAFAKAFPDGPEEAAVVGSSMFGAETYERQLRRQAVELGVKARVEFRGFREHVELELARLDILVHSSTIPEPFGQVVVEGMGAGLPVVASGAGGPAEVITDGVDGLLFPSGDVDALAHLLRRLGGDERLRQRLGTAALIRAADFGAIRVAERVMEVYRHALLEGMEDGPALA